MSDHRSNQEERLNLKEVIAMGVGGMVGGGIFSVLGLAIAQAGHAAPIAFALGGFIALLTGLSYASLGLHYESDGGSFTYLEHAFENRNIAGIGGWLLLVGYVGTMALYAFTFGVYGAAMLGADEAAHPLMHHLLQSLILLLFLSINLYGVKASGTSELMLVTVKVLILALFGIIGIFYARADHLLPVFNQGYVGVVMGAALIFVAYEGFELIPNAVREMENPQRNLRRGIIWSIGITVVIYVLVSLVAVGNLTLDEVQQYKEYVLAVAAKPMLGQAGFLLIGLAALLSTASAINATMFGTARLGMEMAVGQALPKLFSRRSPVNHIPWVSLLAITLITLAFVNTANLTIISSFASSTFLLIFAAINLSAWKLRKTINPQASRWQAEILPLTGVVLSLLSWATLMIYLWQSARDSVIWIGVTYAAIIVLELAFSQRALWLPRKP
ncbi:MAG: APC family permease [Thiotrichales bacterium]